MGREQIDDIGQEPDLFPELPRGKRKKVNYRDMVSSTLNLIRDRAGVTTPEIAQRVQVSPRTVEKWVQGSNLPAEWASRLLLKELRSVWPDCFNPR